MIRPIDAVLFDLGGVFTDSPFGAIERVEAELGARPGQLADIMFGPYHEDTDHAWHRLERGEITLRAARDEIMSEGARQGFEFDPVRVILGLKSDGGVRDALVERVRELRRDGYATALITNNAAEFRSGWRSLLPVDELFHAVIDSSEVGMRKPNPAIFQLALERLGNVPPHRSAFLDDSESNVKAAAELGIHGLLVGDDPLRVLEKLDRLLGI